MLIRRFALISCLLISSLAFAQAPQKDTKLLPAQASHRQTKSSVINTRQFFPAIDDVMTFRPERPENPMQFPDYPGSNNNLPVGETLSFARTMTQGLFPGITGTGWTPADPDIAVGPNQIVAVVNSSIAFFDKDGTKTFQQLSENFFDGVSAGSFQFDPKCIYDRVHDRFVLIFLEQDNQPQTSKILFAISDDGDPDGTWYQYRIEAKTGTKNQTAWLDYPGFGYNKDAYVVSGNMFGFRRGFYGVQMIVIPSSDVLSNGTLTTTHLTDSSGASVQMAEVISTTSNYVYGVSRNGTSAVRVYAVDTSGSPSAVSTTVTVPTNASPAGDAESTSGRFLDSIDGRVFNAVWRDEKLVTAHNIEGQNFVGSRWYQLDTTNWPGSGSVTLTQSGNIDSPTHNYFMPAINMNAAGDISAIFTGSNTSTTADIMISGRVASDPAGSMGAPIMLQSAAGDNYTQGRWGDYFGVDVDPVDDTTFWGVAMTVRADNNWKTSIYSWTVTSNVVPQVTSVTLDPDTLIGGNKSTGTVTLNMAADGDTVIALSSSDTAATVPATVTILDGQTSATFTVSTTVVDSTTDATITGTLGSSSANGALTIHPVGGPPTATKVFITSVSYSTSGGKGGNKNLRVTIACEDDLGAAVEGASVSISLTNDDGGAWTGTASTGADGTVTFQLRNAPAAFYTTLVTALSAAGLTWDSVTPPNGYQKN